MLAEFSADGRQVYWIRQYGDCEGIGSAIVRAADRSIVLAGTLAEAERWNDAFLLDAGEPTESNIGPVIPRESPVKEQNAASPAF